MTSTNVTLNPSDINGIWTLSNGNRTATVAVGTNANIRATHGKTKGKWYFEVKLDSGSNMMIIGVTNKTYPITSTVSSGTTGDALNFRGYYANNGNRMPENTTYGTACSVGNIIGVALDMDNGNLEFYKNGVSMGISHTNLKSMGEVFPHFKDMTSSTKTFTVNFGTSPFTYPIPNGYSAYNVGFLNKLLLLSNDGNVKRLEKGEYSTTNAIPVMTSNTSPSGEAFTSRKASDDYFIFDGKSSTGTLITNSSGGGSYVYGYKFPHKIRIGKYSILLGGNTGASPKAWKFEGSNDGLNYTKLGEVNNQINWAVNVERVFEADVVDDYTYYRVNVTELNGIGCYIYELKMFELSLSKIEQLPHNSEQNLIKYGMESPVQLDALFSNKNYILQDTVSENEDGLWTTQLNRKPLSIRFD